MNRLKQLFQKLGFDKNNGLFLLNESDQWIHNYPYRISRILKDVIKPTAFFNIFNNQIFSSHPTPINQSFILFFDNPTKEVEENIYKQVINFGLAQIVFIIRKDTIDLYHGNDFLSKGARILRKIKESNDINGFDDYTFISILTGNSLKNLEVKRSSIDEYLLSNITDARRILVASDGLQLAPQAANRLIGRLLFVSYLIDRDVTFNDQSYITGSTKTERKVAFKQLILDKLSLYKFFKYLNKKYNGDMFPLREKEGKKEIYNEESLVNTEHLKVLYYLFNCAEMFKTGQSYNGYAVQPSLFDLYDFEIIPVELISSIYENFIGNEYENEKLQLSKQKEIKAYYTPAYIVDYILSQTIIPYLEDPSKTNSNCRVLDPACGSGIFLVETLRKIIEKELVLTTNQKISDKRLWQLIKSNIFGIDIDSDAIDISVFSLYITILDYKQPAEIEKFKFQKLKEENLFGGDSADFFNIKHPFNVKIKNLDFIIGNPPWGTVSNSRYLEYIANRDAEESQGKNKDNSIPVKIGDKEICQAFLIRTSDFATKNRISKCSLIVSSKVLYNTESSSKAFRNYFLRKFHIKQVVELSPVNNKIRGGNHIFDHARQPAAIITFVPEMGNSSTVLNIVQHITVKPNRFFLYNKVILVEKHDVKNIQQKYFMEEMGGYDWLWKVLVHGNALDIHFIKRLKSDYDTVEKYIEDKYESNGGLKIKDGDKKNDTSEILKYKYLDAEREFRPFITNPNYSWEKVIEIKNLKSGSVGYLPNLKYFKGNKLLLKKGVVLNPREGEHYFGAVTAYNNQNICFSSTICSIIPKSNNTNKERNFLLALSALFNSKFFTYLLINTSSSAGIERSRVHFKEFFNFPLQYNETLSSLAYSITNKIDDTNELSISQVKDKIEKCIATLYKFNEVEKSLIDYSIDISIPILLREERSGIYRPIDFAKKVDMNYIENYIKIFIKSFEHKLRKNNKYLVAEAIQTEYFIRINFKISNTDKNSITFIESTNNEITAILGDLSIYSVCKDLYIQQDVRGFTKSSFYIIKPNERKLWHAAVAYLDAIEFDEEITKAEISLTKSNNQHERS